MYIKEVTNTEMVSAIALIILGIVFIVLGYFLPIPAWARGLLYAVGVIMLVLGIIFLILPIAGLMTLPITTY